MYKSRRDVIPLTPDDEIIVDLGFSAPGVLAWASVNYRARLNEHWREVVRYDNAPGVAHRHRFWQARAEAPLPAGTTATQLIQIAKRDLRKNWETYRHLLAASL